MIKIPINLFFIFFQFFCFAQGIPKDTVFIKYQDQDNDTLYIEGGVDPNMKQVLVGTTVLPYSKKNISLIWEGIELADLTLFKNCNEHPKNFKLYPIFNAIQKDSNFLVVDVSIVDNCCYNFLGEASIENDTLHLIYNGYGNYCACSCCFRLEYTFKKLDDYPSKKIKYVSIENRERTITKKIIQNE